MTALGWLAIGMLALLVLFLGALAHDLRNERDAYRRRARALDVLRGGR